MFSLCCAHYSTKETMCVWVKFLHGYMVVNLVMHLLFFLILSLYFYPYSFTSESIHFFGSSSISYTLHVNISSPLLSPFDPNPLFPLLSPFLPWPSQFFLNLVNPMLYLSNPTLSQLNLLYPKVMYFPYFIITHVIFFIFHIFFIFQ